MQLSLKISKRTLMLPFEELPFAYLIFRFYLVFIPSSIQKIALFSVLILYIIYNTKFEWLKARYTNPALVYLFIGVLSIFVPWIYGTGDYSYFSKLISGVLDILCWMAFFIHVLKKSVFTTFENELAKRLGTIVGLYILFTFACIISPSLKSIWQNVVSFTDKEIMMLAYSKYSGRIGWNGFAGFNSTLSCSILVLIGILNIDSEFRLSNEIRFKNVVPVLIGMVGNFLYGRTGLLVSIAMILLYCFIMSVRYGKIKLFLYIFFGVIIAFAAISILKNHIAAFDSIYRWAFEPILNYLNGDGFESTSMTALGAMYVLPNSKTFFVGDGLYTNTATGFYYMNTDVGFLRLLYFWGIIPTILLYYCSLSGFCHTLYKKGLFLLPIVLLIGFEMKGEACRLMLSISTALLIYRLPIEMNSANYRIEQ